MNRYTNFILTVIAVVMLGILFKGEINNPAHAWENCRGMDVVKSRLTKVLNNLNVINNNILALRN